MITRSKVVCVGITNFFLLWMVVFLHYGGRKTLEPMYPQTERSAERNGSQMEGSEERNVPASNSLKTQICYSRIPKTGSSGAVGLLKQVNGDKTVGNIKLAFKPLADVRFPRVYNQDTYGKKFVRSLRDSPKPWFMYPHYHFVDFQNISSGFEGMTYISVLRDPISRTVSHFNYLRRHPQYAKQWFKTKKDEHMSIDECFQGKHPECTTPTFYLTYMISYFCGYHEICSLANKESLNLAKSNFHKFSVVGILEEYDDFWFLMETTFPQYFKGILAKYRETVEAGKSQKNKTRYVSRPSNETLALMRDALSLDIEFYEWVKQQVHHRVSKLKS